MDMKNYLQTQITLYEEDKKEEASMRCSLLHGSWDQILQRCPSVDRIVSALYLLQYSPDPFHIYTSYQATLEGVLCVSVFFLNSRISSFGKFFKFVTLTLSCFDLGSNMNWSIVWVIMGYPQNAGVLVVLVRPANHKRVISANWRPCLIPHWQSYCHQVRTV